MEAWADAPGGVAGRLSAVVVASPGAVGGGARPDGSGMRESRAAVWMVALAYARLAAIGSSWRPGWAVVVRFAIY